MRWNILITGGRVIDPFQGIDGIRDVAIAGTRVAEVGENLPADQAETVIDARGKVVTPGFIDLHVHNYTSRGNRPSVDSDTTNMANGVTTASDAGPATPAEDPPDRDSECANTQDRHHPLATRRRRVPPRRRPRPRTLQRGL